MVQFVSRTARNNNFSQVILRLLTLKGALMSMKFIEPDLQQTIPVSYILEKFIVSSENKKWLSSLFLKDFKLPPNSEDDLSNFICNINEEDANAFMLSFLFDFCVSNPDYFIESKLLFERIKIIPALFTQKADGKPSVFKSCIANILDNIKYCAKKDNNFSEEYQRKLQEIRTSSSFEERAVYYVKLVFQNLPKRPYEKGKFLLETWADDFYKNMPYSVRLIAELEEMPENELNINYSFQGRLIPLYNILAFPFIVCGKELYTCIQKTIHLLFHTTTGQIFSSNEITQIKIPRWDENNNIHEVFFIFAQTSNDKDISMLILEKIFERVNPVDIPYIFFKYIEDHTSSIYRPLLKGGDSDVIKPILTELEYLDWALTTDTNDPHKIYFDKSRLFLDYIDNLSDPAPKDKLELFQELFFQKTASSNAFQDKFWNYREKTIKDVLYWVAQEIIHSELRFPDQKERANALYEEFVDVIAKGAAKYPVESFLSEGLENLPIQKQNDYGLVVFKRYCEKLELKNHKDALFISEFWFKYFYLEQPFFSSVISLSQYRYSSELKEEGPFFYENIFCKFIDDEDFICRFLSIPQNFSSAFSLAVYCLARWVLYQKNKDENISNIISDMKKASKLLYDEKITFPDKIEKLIRSYKIPDELKIKGYDNEAIRFLFYLTAALNGEQYQNILKNLHSAEKHFPLYFIRYNYSHDKIVQEEFLDFLFSLKNPSGLGNDNEIYNLKLIQEACKEGVLEKQTVLEKITNYIDKNRKVLFKSPEIKRLISYFFIETEKGETNEAQTAFFTQLCERAIQENDDSCTELYLFLKIRFDFHNKTDTILEKQTDINDILVTRCCKMLNNFKKNIEQKKFPEDEYHFLNDYILPASDFIWERTGNIWKALKPIILAFRASKDILLDESLNSTNNNLSYLFLNMITSFFRIEDQEKLKELRYNMANDFAEYLKPAKNERQAEKYTKKERETEGFALSYTEPSPYWRYAYVRALGDLSIKTDKRGHYFQKILENVSEKDPSEDVKSAAKKVMEELDSIRKGYSGANHKKCLFEAFWWLKNAHMLSLGGKVDSKKALEQRNKEWR